MVDEKKSKVTGKKAEENNLDDLKREMDIDDHKIPVEDLYKRYETHPEK